MTRSVRSLDYLLELKGFTEEIIYLLNDILPEEFIDFYEMSDIIIYLENMENNELNPKLTNIDMEIQE